jgi:hypothetical protein
MSIQLLPLCSSAKVTIRDGMTGANARVYLPFYGYWFASGQQYTFPSGVAAQPQQLTMGGTSKPDTFQKDCCTC